jgi:hypothetical protein
VEEAEEVQKVEEWKEWRRGEQRGRESRKAEEVEKVKVVEGGAVAEGGAGVMAEICAGCGRREDMMRLRRAAVGALIFAVGAFSQAASGERTVQMKTKGKPAPERGARVLNNLVTELLNVSADRASYRFTNPRDGWVFISSTARAKGSDSMRLSIDNEPKEKAAIVHEGGRAKTQEAMRFLGAGEHRVSASRNGKAQIERLIVRAVPETIYCQFPQNPHVSEYGTYDWEFLQKHVLHSTNTIVSSDSPNYKPYVEEWKKQGRRWITACGVPGLSSDAPITAEEAYRYWSGIGGYRNPVLNGVIADEFGDAPAEKYAAWAQAIARLRRFKGKKFYAWCGPLYGSEPMRRFAETLMKGGDLFAFERYLKEEPTEQAASESLDMRLITEMLILRKVFPGSERHTVMTLGYMSAPPESLDTHPGINYRVWMDMQFNALANNPAFEGLYGVMEYLSSYADEEIVRWTGRLYRHYCIEGKRSLLSKDPYVLPHLKNPDFDNGTDGWTAAPAEEGTIQTKHMEGFSWLQGRYPPMRQGDNFLWMKRSARGPNAVSQEIRKLEPGRLYSLKIYSADYQELIQGKSVRQKHAISIVLDGVDTIPSKTIQHVFPNCYSHHHGPFDDKNKAWMNYHQRVFRAKGDKTRLTITDWASATDAGGPVGQELMLNFIEVQPYLED